MGGSTAALTSVILLDLAVITLVGGLLSALAVRLRQPAVIGEIVAGILLGPTLLGALPGHLTTVLFLVAARPVLTALADVGVVLFMFGVGYEIDFRVRRAVAGTALASVLLPFGLGVALALLLYGEHGGGLAGHGVDRTSFALFLGVALAVTAFPVLARIIAACGLAGTPFSTFTLSCAAVADVAAWAMLAFVTALITGHGLAGGAVRCAILLTYVLASVFAVRPALRRVLRAERVRRHRLGVAFPFAVIGVFLSAWVTSRLGFQPIFGAFVFGAVFPRDVVREAAPALPRLVVRASVLLMPLFFVSAGLSADISGLGGHEWLECLLVVAVACVGKFAGAAGAARLTGLPPRRAAAVGVLMNCRGLTELIVIQVGVTLGILDERLTSIMIVMAVVTTAVATPLFRKLYNDPDQVDRGGAITVAERVLTLSGSE